MFYDKVREDRQCSTGSPHQASEILQLQRTYGLEVLIFLLNMIRHCNDRPVLGILGIDWTGD